MPDAWPDAAADDEQALLMTNLDGGPEDTTAWQPTPKRRKQPVSIRTALLLLVIPALLLLWILITWTTRKHPPGSESDPHSPESDAFFLNPSFDRTAPPKTRVYRWTVSLVPVPGAGENRTRIVVNGRSPGPIIQANVHDRILVYVTNGLENEGTSIHWHGLPLPQTPFYDGTAGISQCPIPPGKTLLYNFTFGGWTGTTWWHGHTAMQHTDGLFGPLVVHAPDDDGHKYTYASEHVLTLSDVYTTASANALLESYLNEHSTETVPEPVPDRVAINGRGGGAHRDDDLSPISMRTRVDDSSQRYPTRGGEDDEDGYVEVRVEPGKTTRLRLIHAGSFAPLRVSIDNHVLTIIEADGSSVAPVRVRDLVMQPAQRYSVLVARGAADADTGDEHETSQAFWIRARMVQDRFAYDNPNMQPEARAILRYASGLEPVPRATIPRTQRSSMPRTHHAVFPQTHPPLERDGEEAAAGNEDAHDSLPPFDEWALRPPPSPPNAHPSSPAPNTEPDPDPDSADGRPLFPNTDPGDVLTLPFTFSIQRTHDLNWRSFINGTSWEIPAAGEAAGVGDVAGVYTANDNMEGGMSAGVRVWPGDQLIATLAHRQTVDFVITNLDDGEHPFHLHGYAPWLLGSGSGRYKPGRARLEMENPLCRDTFTVPSRGWAVVRIVTNNAGYWAFHCHIAWHMMGGGLFQIAVPPPADGDAAVLPLPDDIVEQCKMWV